MKTISRVKPEKSPIIKTQIKVRREAAGITLRTAAQHAGVSAATLCRIEQGRSPDIRTAFKLARFFETTVEELFGELAA